MGVPAFSAWSDKPLAVRAGEVSCIFVSRSDRSDIPVGHDRPWMVDRACFARRALTGG
jgi:hypothetical protein